MTESKDPPITPQEFTFGVNVVDIGDLRVARGLSRRPHSACPHMRLNYDSRERRVWCEDCEKTIEAFDAFSILVECHHEAWAKIERRQKEVVEAQKHSMISLAAKALDKIWRGRRMVPVCPACGQGLFPEDFKDGVGRSMGRDYALRLRQQVNKPVKT